MEKNGKCGKLTFWAVSLAVKPKSSVLQSRRRRQQKRKRKMRNYILCVHQERAQNRKLTMIVHWICTMLESQQDSSGRPSWYDLLCPTAVLQILGTHFPCQSPTRLAASVKTMAKEEQKKEKRRICERCPPNAVWGKWLYHKCCAALLFQ